MRETDTGKSAPTLEVIRLRTSQSYDIASTPDFRPQLSLCVMVVQIGL